MEIQLTPASMTYFREEFRRARLVALSDSENFREIIYCVERLGLALTRALATLGTYQGEIVKVAEKSALGKQVPTSARDYHLPCSELYQIVMQGRNDALHQGVAARHLTSHAVQLALVLEDALMPPEPKTADFIVRGVVCAEPWQPVSFVRQQMLANSFSYIPIHWSPAGEATWHLFSDVALSRFLRSAPNKEERDRRLALRVAEAVPDGLLVVPARVVRFDLDLRQLAAELEAAPVLIVAAEDRSKLLGIITAFDLL